MLLSMVMKLLSTTPVSKGIVTKSIIVASTVMMVISGPILALNQAYADQWDNQIAALNTQMQQYQTQASQLDAQAKTYQAALDQITAQKNAIIAQINISQQKYTVLQKQIDDTQSQITANKDALGGIIADMYVDGSITPLEMLASSKDIGDYVDQQQYRNAIQDNLSKTITQINALKKKLEKSQQDVASVMQQQDSQKAQLAAAEAEQQSLVEKTKGDEAAYQQLAGNAQSQMASAAAQQRAYYASLQAQSGGSGGGSQGVVGSFVYTNWSGNQGCGSDGYPYCGTQDSYSDPWGLYNRECVSYAAWRISAGYGRQVNNFGGAGTAYQWPSAARATRVYDPQPGDAVVLPATSGFAPVGHLMVVESVNGDWLHVSQYNFYGTGEYSTMDIKKTGVIFLRFPAK